ncbi:MAG: type 4a pilus biogenesis protein PilO [Bacteriovoracaceae bacterium]|nr:type 4a pilus biogenesis protein PilO [Bacteriovoracaceae bacterium]
MKDVLVKNLHWFIFAYAAQGLFLMYTEKDEQYQALVTQTPSIKIKIQREKRKLVQIEEFKKNLAATKDRVKEVVKQIEKVQKQLPTDVNDAEVQELLGNIAEKLKMKKPKQVPKKEDNLGFYFAKEYEFQGRGTFLQSLIFFESLAKAERILNVKNVKIEHISDKVRSRFQIIDMQTTVESFRYNKNYKEKSGVEEIEQQFKVN